MNTMNAKVFNLTIDFNNFILIHQYLCWHVKTIATYVRASTDINELYNGGKFKLKSKSTV